MFAAPIATSCAHPALHFVKNEQGLVANGNVAQRIQDLRMRSRTFKDCIWGGERRIDPLTTAVVYGDICGAKKRR